MSLVGVGHWDASKPHIEGELIGCYDDISKKVDEAPIQDDAAAGRGAQRKLAPSSILRRIDLD